MSKDSREDLKYIFFPAGAQLSEDFAKYNDLYREQQFNADPSKKGFFELNRRVKAIKFRGVTSTGFVIPVTALDYLEKQPVLQVGDEFTSLEEVEICRKYVVPGPTQGTPGAKGDKQSRINNRLVDMMVKNQFRFHSETGHLAKNIHVLQVNDTILLSDKWHGSSCILSKVLVRKKLNLWQKFLNLIGGKVPDTAYGYIYSSGKPKSNLPKGIEGARVNNGPDFYSSNIWKRAMDDYKEVLEDGISIYGELVGYTEGGSFIQKGYNYGCSAEYGTSLKEHLATEGKIPTLYRFVVYRITYTKPDGSVIEFSWPQVKAYCEKYQIEHVKEFFYGSTAELMSKFVSGWRNPFNDEDIHQQLFDALQNAYNMEKTCGHCLTGVPAEGMVLRIDNNPSFTAFKLKAKAFTKKESDDMDNGETNIEDNA